jgi:hypothetical protein
MDACTRAVRTAPADGSIRGWTSWVDGMDGDPALGREADGRLLLAARHQGQVWLNTHGR